MNTRLMNTRLTEIMTANNVGKELQDFVNDVFDLIPYGTEQQRIESAISIGILHANIMMADAEKRLNEKIQEAKEFNKKFADA